MRINELTPFKKTGAYRAAADIKKDKHVAPYIKFENLKDELEKMGFKFINRGWFAQVFEHPSLPYVIKMFNNDPNYLKYFEWVRQNQDNPHVPQIRGKYIKIDENTYAVRMEKLIPFTSNDQDLIRKYIDPMYDSEFYNLFAYSNAKYLQKIILIYLK